MKQPETSQLSHPDHQFLYKHDRYEVFNSKAESFEARFYHQRYAQTLKQIYQECKKRGWNSTNLKVLDVACAQSNFSLALAEAGFRVFSLDLRLEFLNYSRLKYEQGEIDWINGSIEDFPFKEKTFDIILAGEILEHVAYPDQLLRKIRHLCKPSGFILLSTPNGQRFGNPLPTFHELQNQHLLIKKQFEPDANGHLFLLTKSELKKMANNAGLFMERHEFLGTPWITGGLKGGFLPKLLPLGFRKILDGLTRFFPFLGAYFTEGQIAILTLEKHEADQSGFSFYCPGCEKTTSAVFCETSGSFNLYQCCSCGLIYSNPMKAGNAEFYEMGTEYGDKWEFNFLAEQLHPETAAGNLLDLGCGDGRFLSLLPPSVRGMGYDFNPKAVKTAQNRYGLKNVYHGDLNTFKEQFPTQKFNYVTVFHVLEHLENPGAFLNQVRQCLTEDGRLMLSVPNPNRWTLQITRENWDLPPHHLTRWTPLSLMKLFENHGYEIEDLWHEPIQTLTQVRSGFQDILWKFTFKYLSFGMTKHLQPQPEYSEKGSSSSFSMTQGLIRLLSKMKTLCLFLAVEIFSLLAFPFLYLSKSQGKSMLVKARPLRTELPGKVALLMHNPTSVTGGMERFNAYVASFLKEEGYEVTLRDASCAKVNALLQRWWNPYVVYQSMLKDFNAQEYKFIITVGFAGGALKGPNVFNISFGTAKTYLESIQAWKLNRWKLFWEMFWCIQFDRWGKKGQHCIATSHLVQNELERDYGISSTLISCGVDTHHFRRNAERGAALRNQFNIPADALVGAFVGRWALLHKGLDYLIPLLEKRTDIHWLLATDGNPALKGSHIHLAKNVTYEALPAFYSAADFSVQLSRYESVGFSFLESLACGVPVLSTRVGVVPEVYKDKPLADFIVDREDTKEIENQIEKFKSKPFREMTGELVRKEVEKHFSLGAWKSRMRNYLEIFSKDTP